MMRLAPSKGTFHLLQTRVPIVPISITFNNKGTKLYRKPTGLFILGNQFYQFQRTRKRIYVSVLRSFRTDE